MLRFIYLLFIFLLSHSQQCLGLQYAYYWRDFINGEVPSDAIIAGQNLKGENIYIGQGHANETGIITCEIFSGVEEVHMPVDGIRTTKDNIKILCGPQQNLYWEQTSSSKMSSLLRDHVAVIGGHEYSTWRNAHGPLYVGRLKFHGELKIGKIVPYYGPYAILFNNNMTQEQLVGDYEVLLLK